MTTLNVKRSIANVIAIKIPLAICIPFMVQNCVHSVFHIETTSLLQPAFITPLEGLNRELLLHIADIKIPSKC